MPELIEGGIDLVRLVGLDAVAERRAALITPVQELLIDTIKPLGKCLHEQDIWQSKQCLSYLPCKVLRLSFQNRLLLLELSSVCLSTCHKYDEKSLIAVQTQPRLASKIPLWLHPWIGRNVIGPRCRATCARRSVMAKGTSSSSVPCPMKIGRVTWRFLLTLPKRSLIKRWTGDLGTHDSIAWACSGRFVNATRHDQTGHLLAGGEVDGYGGRHPATSH